MGNATPVFRFLLADKGSRHWPYRWVRSKVAPWVLHLQGPGQSRRWRRCSCGRCYARTNQRWRRPASKPASTGQLRRRRPSPATMWESILAPLCGSWTRHSAALGTSAFGRIGCTRPMSADKIHLLWMTMRLWLHEYQLQHTPLNEFLLALGTCKQSVFRWYTKSFSMVMLEP